MRRLAALLCLALSCAGCGWVQISGAPRPVFRPQAQPLASRMAWIDTQSLFDSLGTPERLARGLERLAATGFTDVVVEVKPASGDVAYPSRIATRLTASGGHRLDPAWDVPADAIRLGRALGLRVHLAMNVFAEGDHARRTGPVYGTRRLWQTTVLAPDGTPRVATRLRPDERTTDIAYVNPVRPDVRNHALAVASELVGRYQPDGLWLDRVRFESAFADVSPEAREAFEQWLHVPVARWPADVLERTPAGLVRGPLYPKWREWQATTIRTFVEAARVTVRGVSPATRLGLVAPAEFDAAAEVGLNWASPAYDPAGEIAWAGPMYREKGVATLVDVLAAEMPVSLARADTLLLRRVDSRVAGAARVVPYLHLRAFPTAEAFEAAVRQTLATSGSVLVSHYGDLARHPAYWAALRRAFPAPEPAGAATR